MLVRPKLEYDSPAWNPHTSSQTIHLERIQHYAARFVAHDHRRTTSPTSLVLTLNWQTLERRRIIKQAMTFYKILNNIIKINPPTGLLARSHNRHHYIVGLHVPRSRLNTVVYSYYPRAIRICNTIPKAITAITQPESFQAALKQTPFHHPNSSKLIVTKPHSGILVLMLSRLLPVSWQCHTVVSDHTLPNLPPTIPNHTTIIHLSYINIQSSTNKLSNLGI